MALIRTCEGDNFFVDYDTDKGMYRVSAFEPDVDYIKDEYWFDAYEEKELDKSFPQTIGDITFYSKAELFEWVERQQNINKMSVLFVNIPDEIVDKFNSIGCTSFQITTDELEKILEEQENV